MEDNATEGYAVRHAYYKKESTLQKILEFKLKILRTILEFLQMKRFKNGANQCSNEYVEYIFLLHKLQFELSYNLVNV